MVGFQRVLHSQKEAEAQNSEHSPSYLDGGQTRLPFRDSGHDRLAIHPGHKADAHQPPAPAIPTGAGSTEARQPTT